MTITWYGQTCFRLQNPRSNILIDPFGSRLGLRSPKIGGARVVLVSGATLPKINGEETFFIFGPGEYERENAAIQGIASSGGAKEEENHSTLYTLELENIRVAHLNLSSGSSFSDKDIEELGEIDVLLLPVGGKREFLDAAEAAEVVRTTEPKIVIPMAYAIPGLKVKLEKIDPFLRAMGAGKVVPQPKLVVKKKDLMEGETKIVVLKPT